MIAIWKIFNVTQRASRAFHDIVRITTQGGESVERVREKGSGSSI